MAPLNSTNVYITYTWNNHESETKVIKSLPNTCTNYNKIVSQRLFYKKSF